jgi:hypothetical protein
MFSHTERQCVWTVTKYKNMTKYRPITEYKTVTKYHPDTYETKSRTATKYYPDKYETRYREVVKQYDIPTGKYEPIEYKTIDTKWFGS